jgi:transcriptional regulator with XRE-family HTH domain
MTISKLKKIKQPQIGQLIYELRQELGLTQEELAVSLGVTFSHWSPVRKIIRLRSPFTTLNQLSKYKMALIISLRFVSLYN